MTLSIYHSSGGSLLRKGRPPRQGFDSFILGITRPIRGLNCGNLLGVTLTTYSGPNAGGILIITAPVTYENIDFQSTQIDIRSSNVHFINCKWTWTKINSGDTAAGQDPLVYAASNFSMVIGLRNGTTFTNRTFTRCTFNNLSQWAPVTCAAIGYGYKMDRCAITGFGDCVQAICPTSTPDADVNVEILGCYLGELSFWDAPTIGTVHPSTRHQHCDCFQWQGGKGARIEGCDIQAHYSTTVGTGTPNSGNDTGGLRASANPYTQAQAEARRYEIVEGSGLYSAGQVGAFLGGSIAGLMWSQSAAGTIPDCIVKNNWGSGGSQWLNGGGASGTPFGVVTGNRVENNQRAPGWAISLLSTVTATVSNNTWLDGSGTIPRRNG